MRRQGCSTGGRAAGSAYFTGSMATVLAVLVAGAALSAAGAAAGPWGGALLVVGSLNVDVTILVDRLPRRHETLIARSPSAATAVGGKGANQAVAAARLRPAAGTEVRFVTNFGSDAHAAALEGVLVENGVDTSHSTRSSSNPSGQGFVLLEGDGSVSSVVAGGANAAWTTDKASAALGALKGAAVVMLQREVPEDVNVLFANAAKRDGIPVLLDAGGEDSPLGNSLLQNVDFLCPNEGELGRLTGLSTSTEHLVVTAARSLQSRGAKNVLVTLGERGSLLLSSDGSVLRQGPMPLPGGRVVDATGAGDAYRAAFAVALVEGRPLAECMAFGAAAGAVAVTRAGAVPSLPWRSECELLLASEQPLQPLSASGIANSSLPSCRTGDGSQQGYCEAEEHKLRFASRLNSMKARQDLAKGGGDDLLGMVARHGNIQGVDAVFFNYPQHLKGHEQESVRRALDEAGLAAGAVCIRFPDSMGQGAFTNPEDSVRKEAVKLAVEGCQWARQLGAEELVVWPQTDGYDYHLQIDYTAAWQRAVESFQAVCDACPDIKVSLEFKPTDESTRFSVVPSTGAALLLAQEVQRPNMGLTLDVGHMIMAGENPAQSVEMVSRAGKLYGMQFGDGHSRLGAEDGLMFGSVHQSMALELLVWLQKLNYKGYIYFDTFPRNEDPIREAEYNVRRFQAFWHKAEATRKAGIEKILVRHDAMGSLELLETL